MAPATQASERSDWAGMALSALAPLAAAAGLLWVWHEPGWEPSPAWIYGLMALAPLDFIRALMLAFLGDAYKKGDTPRAALRQFLGSIAVLAAMGLLWALFEIGPMAIFEALTSPLFYQVAALPVAVMLLDSLAGICVFRGDRLRQAQRLNALAQDLGEWCVFWALRLPWVIAGLCALLALGKVLDLRVLASLPAIDIRWLRQAGLLYLACYFLGKAVLTAHVHSARFARTGTALLAAPWARWLSGTRKQNVATPRR